MARQATASEYDVLVLGSGQSGTPLATAFANAGRKTALVERSHIGGTCVNEGCTPTKTIIASGRTAYMTRRAGDFGVWLGSDAGSVRVDMEAVRQHKRDIVDRWRQGGEGRLRKAGVEVLEGEASFISSREVRVRLNDSGQVKLVTAPIIVINAGERPARPRIPGLDKVPQERILNSTSVMELEEVPSHLVVLGGGYIGLEFGQLLRRFGAEVTIVQRNKQLMPREDADVAEAMRAILQEDGITVHLSSTIDEVEEGSWAWERTMKARITTGSGEKLETACSHILLAAGRTSNTDSLNLSAAGVDLDSRGHVVVNEKLETNVPGIYAMGDIHGGPAFTHMSYDDWRILRANLLPETVPPTTPQMATTQASLSRNLTPYVVYTDPQLGHVGAHEPDVRRREVKTAAMPMSYVARAIETQETRGLMKAIVDAQTGEILGFTCLGMEGGEVMAVVQTAMMGGLKWWDLEAAVWTHPSLAESLNSLWGYLQ